MYYIQYTIYYIYIYYILYVSGNLLTIYRKYGNLIGYRTRYLSVWIYSVCGMKASNSRWRLFPAFQKTFWKRN